MIQFGKGKSLVQLIDRKKFDALCEKWTMDKWVRKFTTWEQTITHVMAYVLRLQSLREVEAALSVPRSTFSDANAKRCCGFYQELCSMVLEEIRQKTRNHKIKRALKALDSTRCDVHGSLASFPIWRDKKAKFKKASVKLHCIWNVEDQWIEDFRTTAGSRGDSPVGKYFKISSGSIYIFDRAYNDIEFWLKITDNESDFVTRLKSCPTRRIQKKLILDQQKDKDGVLWEGDWKPTQMAYSEHSNLPKDIKFRHIIYRDPETKKVFDFVTSDWKLNAQTIADIYRKRWAVELLFRWLKGHLNIRYFAAKNRNAIMTQMAVAVLVQLLVQLFKLETKTKSTQWECLRFIRMALIRKSLENSGLQHYDRWKPLSMDRLRS